MEIRCKRCRNVLTQPLVRAEANFQPDTRDRQPFVPQGVAYFEQGRYWSVEPGASGIWCIHLESQLGMQLTTDPTRLNGCCDLDGCDGPNLLCAHCRAAVATAKKDCWMPHCILFSPTATEAVAASASTYRYAPSPIIDGAQDH